jgi:hypothetical protein
MVREFNTANVLNETFNKAPIHKLIYLTVLGMVNALLEFFLVQLEVVGKGKSHHRVLYIL